MSERTEMRITGDLRCRHCEASVLDMSCKVLEWPRSKIDEAPCGFALGIVIDSHIQYLARCGLCFNFTSARSVVGRYLRPVKRTPCNDCKVLIKLLCRVRDAAPGLSDEIGLTLNQFGVT